MTLQKQYDMKKEELAEHTTLQKQYDIKKEDSIEKHTCIEGMIPQPQPGHEQSSISVEVKAKGSVQGLQKMRPRRSKRRIQVRARSMQEDYPVGDGYSWKKYGQKDTLGSKHPRVNYRCMYRHEKGCKATKKTQRTDNDPQLFDVVYHREHTCAESVSFMPPATSGSQVTYGAVSSGSTAGVRFVSPATSAGSQVTYERGSQSTTAVQFMSQGTSESQVAYKEVTDAEFLSVPEHVDSTPSSPMDNRLDPFAESVDPTVVSDWGKTVTPAQGKKI